MGERAQISYSRYLCHICKGPVSLGLYTGVVADESGNVVHESCYARKLSSELAKIRKENAS
jgi:hypothetical protein